MDKVEIRPYLAHFVEGYLFGDLSTMARSGPPHAGPGHLGYSMVLSACSGIEFLGALTDARRYEGQPDFQKWFEAFWQNHLYPNDKKLAEPFFRLIRNGLAHTFQTKQRILVSKYQPARHLTVQGDDFVVDCTTLAADLQRAYHESYMPHLDEEKAQARLNERLERWNKEVSRHWKMLVAYSRNVEGKAATVVGGEMDGLPNFAAFETDVMPSGTTPADWKSWLSSGEAVYRAGLASNSPAPGPNIFIAPSRQPDTDDQ